LNKTAIINNRFISYIIIKEFLKNKKNFREILHNKLNNSEISILNRKFITNLTYGVIRHYNLLNNMISENLNFKSNISVDTLSILLLGSYQIHFMNSVPSYAAISTSVDLAKKYTHKHDKFVNAILRKISKKNIIDDDKKYIINSFPKWLKEVYVEDFGKKKAYEIIKYQMNKPTHWIRINKDKEEIITKLKLTNIKYIISKDFDNYINVKTINNDLILENIKKGNIYIQNPSSKLIVDLLKINKEDCIVDACSGPGGKLSNIALSYRLNNKIIGYEINKDRFIKTQTNLKKMKITNVILHNSDFLKCATQKFDKILLDVPCSSTGTINKNPDILIRRKNKDFKFFNKIQFQLLEKSISLLNDKGCILYSTCSINYKENWSIIDNFLHKHSNFFIDNIENDIPRKYIDQRGALNILPNIHNLDGMFAVRIKRK